MTVDRGVIGQVVMVNVNKQELEMKTRPTKKLSHVTAKISVFWMLKMILTKS